MLRDWFYSILLCQMYKRQIMPILSSTKQETLGSVNIKHSEPHYSKMTTINTIWNANFFPYYVHHLYTTEQFCHPSNNRTQLYINAVLCTQTIRDENSYSYFLCFAGYSLWGHLNWTPMWPSIVTTHTMLMISPHSRWFSVALRYSVSDMLCIKLCLLIQRDAQSNNDEHVHQYLQEWL